MTFMSAMAAKFTTNDGGAFVCRRTIVVSRLASPTEILTISDAGPIAGDLPISIQTTRVAVGIRTRRIGEVSEIFELLQTPFENVRLSASFVPLLGKIELNMGLSILKLRGEFELLTKSHSSKRCRWTIVGHRIYWPGELAPSSETW